LGKKKEPGKKERTKNIRWWFDVLSLKEVAEKLGMHYNTIYKYVRAGELKAIKFKKVYRIEEQELEKFIKSKKFKTEINEK